MNSVLNKSKPQLIEEIEKLLERIQELEQKESKRIKMEKALVESEEKFRQLAEQSPDMIFINQKGKVVYANTKCEELTGYSKSEFYSPDFDFKVLIQPEHLESLMENFKKHMEGKEALPTEYAIRTKNGNRVEVIINTKLIKYGEDWAILGIITDITERKKAEDSLRKSEIRYHQLFEDSPVALWEEDFSSVMSYFNELKNRGVSDFRKYFDENNNEVKLCAEKVRVIDVNKAAIVLHQSDSKDQLLGNLDKSLNEKSLEVFKEELIALAEGKSRFESEVEMIAGQNDHRHICLRLYVGQTGEGKSNYSQTLLVINDITERKRVEKTLQESEERFRSLYENSTIGLYRTTPDGQILLANPTLVKMLDYSSFEELRTRDLVKDGFESSYPRSLFIERMEKGGEVYGLESAWKRRDGKTIFVKESARAIRDSDGKILYYDGTVEDITEHKQAEEALRESEVRFRTIYENAPVLIDAFDENGRCVLWNKHCSEIFGWTIDEINAHDDTLALFYPDPAPPCATK